MTTEQRELSGTLSRNRNRENDKQPDFRGSCTIDGVHYWISGWTKQGPDGSKFLSLAFNVKEERRVLSEPQRKVIDDGISF